MQPNELRAGAIAAPLLTYSLTTDPMPVQVSISPTSPSIATLTFVVSCPKSIGSATVAAIEITLPFDSGSTPDAANLCLTEPLLANASISASDGAVWIPSSSGAPGAFYFIPQSGTALVAGQSLTIEFTGLEINTLVGTSLVTINEWAAKGTATPTTPDDGPPSGQQIIAVAKFPYGFYAGNFTSDKPMVKNGEQPVLSWTGSSNATYLMLYESNSVDVSDVQSWSPPNGLTQTTTFILQVSAQQAGQTATMDFSITIEVANPSLTAEDLAVLQDSNLNGAVTVGANLLVNGDVQAGNNLTVVGLLKAQAALNVTGPTLIENELNVSGAGTFSGGLTSKNGLTAGGVVSIFGARQKLGGPGNYIASTDGFVMGTIYPPSTNTVYQDFSIMGGASMGTPNELVVWATGGGTLQVSAGSSSYYHAQTGGMFILPVAAGEKFSLAIPPLTRITPPIPFFAFWWFPLGTAPLAATQTTKKKSRTSKKKTAKKATKR